MKYQIYKKTNLQTMTNIWFFIEVKVKHDTKTNTTKICILGLIIYTLLLSLLLHFKIYGTTAI